MNKYLIDFQKMINWLLPVRKRKDTRKSFLYAGMKWIRDIHAEFITFGTSLKSEALINSQVINFQNYLQDRFGDGILIVHDSISPSLLGEVIDTLIVAGDDGDATTWIGDANGKRARGEQQKGLGNCDAWVQGTCTALTNKDLQA